MNSISKEIMLTIYHMLHTENSTSWFRGLVSSTFLLFISSYIHSL